MMAGLLRVRSLPLADESHQEGAEEQDPGHHGEPEQSFEHEADDGENRPDDEKYDDGDPHASMVGRALGGGYGTKVQRWVLQSLPVWSAPSSPPSGGDSASVGPLIVPGSA